jgi:acylphosphatase
MEAYLLIVSGRVQGVGFRWFAEREALKRAIRGHVRNLEDGNVEIVAQAEPAPLAAFLESIRRGPSASRVERVQTTPIEVDPGLTTFRVKP